ncbi:MULTISPECIES: HD domain-containing protein [Bacillus]|uniref:Phosphohydrolase n=2 Tax=Bacillus TaxID=1386 RepID=A0A0M4G6I1_9BACI|nr:MULTISPECIES: HD domain-containing protein [Bacillus]ALC80478.1 phosphohydrolase [Bacillus gobiensis]MBP1083543.1 uncharacterized protein [Bacillus capparidis]MED1094738.1 HD domain-containing protein [Bacillus capparidis]
MDIVLKTKEFVREKLSGEGTGHDWWHIERVYKNSLSLIEKETVDHVNKEVIELAALLHDIADWKFYNGDETIGPKAAREWLESQNIEQYVIEHVCEIIMNLSFKGANTKSSMKTLEGKIVQDADRLDAIGAIGIARAFAYGGYKGQELFNPMITPKEHRTSAEYKSQNTTTVNHFFEKLLLLKERMNTEAAKEIAHERHHYMVDFLKTLLKENQYENSLHYSKLQNFQSKGSFR